MNSVDPSNPRAIYDVAHGEAPEGHPLSQDHRTQVAAQAALNQSSPPSTGSSSPTNNLLPDEEIDAEEGAAGWTNNVTFPPAPPQMITPKQVTPQEEVRNSVSAMLSKGEVEINSFKITLEHTDPIKIQLAYLIQIFSNLKKSIKQSNSQAISDEAISKINEKFQELMCVDNKNTSVPRDFYTLFQEKNGDELQTLIKDLTDFFSQWLPAAQSPTASSFPTQGIEGAAELKAARDKFNTGMQMRQIAASVSAVSFLILGIFLHLGFFAVAWMFVEYRNAACLAQKIERFSAKNLLFWSPVLRVINYIFFSIVKKHFQFTPPAVIESPSSTQSWANLTTKAPLQSDTVDKVIEHPPLKKPIAALKPIVGENGEGAQQAGHSEGVLEVVIDPSLPGSFPEPADDDQIARSPAKPVASIGEDEGLTASTGVSHPNPETSGNQSNPFPPFDPNQVPRIGEPN